MVDLWFAFAAMSEAGFTNDADERKFKEWMKPELLD
jgi:hypothetical protein